MDWETFAQRLTSTLKDLSEDSFLIIRSASSKNRFVQFANGGTRGFRAEVVGNDFLEPDEKWGDAEEDRLSMLGWLPPDSDQRGINVNHYREWPLPFPFEEIARLAIETVQRVFHAGSPGDLAATGSDDFTELGINTF